MLVEFSVGNFRSFKDPVTLSMVAANLKSRERSLDENTLFKVNDKLSILSSAAIYGPNASGKSNLIAAVYFMRDFVLNSSKETQSQEKIGIDNYKLSTVTENEPSFFEMVFILDDRQYRYGFELDTEKVTAEWLFYVPKSREARLFERDGQNIKVTDAFKEGKGLESRTRENALFLSVVAQFNGDLATKVLSWFRRMRVNRGVDNPNDISFAVSRFADAKNTDAISMLVKAMDLGIDELRAAKEVLRIPPLEDSDKNNVMASLKPFFESVKGMEFPRIKTVHKKYGPEGELMGTAVFDLQDHESAGTKRLFSLTIPILDALSTGRVLFVDELDARLHPIMTCNIIEAFNDKDINEKNAQLVFTTHDTNLLSNKLLRRDQIWFVEKDSFGSSHLYSLAEFRIRNDASFERDYIKGKYGAIPFVGNLKYLLGEEVDVEQE
jgi:uncharacterized protein